MELLHECLHFYLGCDTNKGKFIGIRMKTLWIEPGEKDIEEYDISHVGKSLFLHLRQLSDLTEDQSKQLNKEGFSIGRPSGYAFSNHAFLYLLSLRVDLFGLISAGFALHVP